MYCQYWWSLAVLQSKLRPRLWSQNSRMKPPVPLCSDPGDSISFEPQLLSLFAIGQLAGSCSAAFEMALQDDQTLQHLRSLADFPPSENVKQKVYCTSRVCPQRGMRPKWVGDGMWYPVKLGDNLSHESSLAGSMGITKTRACVIHNFYWPCMLANIADFCWSCYLPVGWQGRRCAQDSATTFDCD